MNAVSTRNFLVESFQPIFDHRFSFSLAATTVWSAGDASLKRSRTPWARRTCRFDVWSAERRSWDWSSRSTANFCWRPRAQANTSATVAEPTAEPPATRTAISRQRRRPREQVATRRTPRSVRRKLVCRCQARAHAKSESHNRPQSIKATKIKEAASKAER